MTGYTKGPWKTYQDGVHPVLEGGSNGNESFAICQCFGPDKAFNARLISAAPDMYEALKNAKSLLVAYAGDNRGQPDSDTIMNAMLDEIDAALAKAEGKA